MKSTDGKILAVLALLALSMGCVTDSNVITVTTSFKKKNGAVTALSGTLATVTTITHLNDQLIINGSNFTGVTGVTLDGVNLVVTPNSDSQMTLSGALNLMAFAMNTALNLVITNAAGAAPVNVTFSLVNDSVLSAHIADGQVGTTELADGSVTAVKLNNMGAEVGQVLKYNGTTWVASDLSGLIYAGNWNANTNSPNLLGGGSLGEYYIVSTIGATNLLGGAGTNSWGVGDWAVWNNVAGQWEKVDNATNVQSFNGRSGAVAPLANDYTWAQINKTTSSISDITDVDTTGVLAGKILKWDGAKWAISDDLNGGEAGSVTTTEIADGTILDADIDAAAAIAQSKISGLPAVVTQVGTNQTDIGNKAPTPGAACAATNKLQWDGSAFTCVADLDTTIADTNTNAGTICAAGQYLDGDTTCKSIPAGTVTGAGTDNFVPLWNLTTGIDASAVSETELNILDGATLTTTEINKLAGATPTTTEFNYVDGVTSAIQTQLDAKVNTSQVATTGANKVLQLLGTGLIDASVIPGDAAQWDNATGGINYAGGNVGVGTATPSTKLDVVGSITASNFIGNVVAAGSVTSRSLANRFSETFNIKDYGALCDNSTDDTAAIQAAVNAALASTKPSVVLYIPSLSRTSKITINLGTSVGKNFTITGLKWSGGLIMRDAVNTHIFEISGGLGQSWKFSIDGLYFGVAVQGNNINAAVLNSNSSTGLDLSFTNNYVNGMPRGISGKFVSFLVQNNMFDFMTDYAIYAESDEFRKMEITGNHFYKIKDSAIHIDGSGDTIFNRDNGTGSGHLTISGNGFDRTFDNTVNQNMIFIKGMDNFTVSANWFNGKTPSSTDAPLNFIHIEDSRNFVISANSMYYAKQGILIRDSSQFEISAIQLRQGNLNGSATINGAISFDNSTDFQASVNVSESQGLGVLINNSRDFTFGGRITNSQMSGLRVWDSHRARLNQVIVKDANQLDSANASEVNGIHIGGDTLSTGIKISSSESYTTNVLTGAKVNLLVDVNTAQCTVSNTSVSPFRTSELGLSNFGSNNNIRSTRGYSQRGTGTTTINNPSTSIVINHNLDVTPSISDITVSLISDASGISSWWVSTITATQFTINLNTPPGTTVSFTWSINSEK